MSEKQENTQNEGGKKPDYIAYNVQETKQGKPVFNRVGAAWQHKDGQGYEIQLDSMPVNGRVTLRELRDKQMQSYQGQEQSQSNDLQHNQQQDQSHEQVNEHGRSR